MIKVICFYKNRISTFGELICFLAKIIRLIPLSHLPVRLALNSPLVSCQNGTFRFFLKMEYHMLLVSFRGDYVCFSQSQASSLLPLPIMY